MNSFKHLSSPEQALLCPEISRGVQGAQQDLQLNLTSLLSTVLIWYFGLLQFVEPCVWYFELFSLSRS